MRGRSGHRSDARPACAQSPFPAPKSHRPEARGGPDHPTRRPERPTGPRAPQIATRCARHSVRPPSGAGHRPPMAMSLCPSRERGSFVPFGGLDGPRSGCGRASRTLRTTLSSAESETSSHRRAAAAKPSEARSDPMRWGRGGAVGRSGLRVMWSGCPPARNLREMGPHLGSTQTGTAWASARYPHAHGFLPAVSLGASRQSLAFRDGSVCQGWPKAIAKRRDEGAPLTGRHGTEGQWTGGTPPALP
ncbi:hypothetical protein SLAV_09680 [Streptomyces lavendulae subsp. lavendulae]|uniref:Uncharacterized protein n=1 Tax=Streptomyces lavendulae subsp. lavendulae TaxID=58340 RepID=A0A2K8PDX2_STRLA|nr:hypothetical protein SLAV_09680 [Streptomyces lavendulae subsp. lavendulae]